MLVKIKHPDLRREKELWQNGLELVAGIDEAGRGAWAGPVVAAVVVMPTNHRRIQGIHDSKLVSPAQRARLYEKITEKALDFGVGIVSHKVIEEINILNATKQAVMEALEMLENPPDYLLADFLDLKDHTKIPFDSIIGGDQKIYSISCASILAKVTRDNIMSSLGGDYERYEFYKHKGYGTKRHQELLVKFGPCDIHRKSYKPIKAFYE